MGITNTLVVLALAVALVPAIVLALRPPSRVVELLVACTAGIASLGLGIFVVHQIYPFRLFELMHLGYLLVVISLPVTLGSWFLLSVLRGSNTRLTAAAGLVAVGFASLGIWGTHIEPNLLRVDRTTVYADVDQPLRIGVLSDLQTPNVGGIEWAAVNALIDEAPDIIVVPGDLFQGEWMTIEENADDFADLLAALVERVEIVAVVSGDSDTSGQLPPIVEAAGAMYLENTIIELTVADQAIRLAGVAVHPSQPKRDTIAALGTPSDAVTVLVSHRPGITYALPPNSDIDLIVSGHTHGGQIRLPIVSNYLWYSDVPPSISAGGLSVLQGFALYVSTGVGLERHASPQVRFGVRPSVGIISLLPAESD